MRKACVDSSLTQGFKWGSLGVPSETKRYPLYENNIKYTQHRLLRQLTRFKQTP